MVGPGLPRQFIAAALVTLLVSGNVPRVRAAELPEGKPAAAPGVSSSAVPTTDVKSLRAQLAVLLDSSDPEVVARGRQLSAFVDFAAATTRAERHAAVEKLAVKILISPSKDGRAGIVKSFVAGGKVRASEFVPAAIFTVPNTGDEPDAARSGGPRVIEMDGRWKSDGFGGCYWDGADSGSNQCQPPGRWKSGASCYWDANDSGPDQCSPPPPSNPPAECYYEGSSSGCATQQDRDDALALVASATAESEALQAQANSDWAEYQDYCSQNPQDCQDEDSDLWRPVHGPACDKIDCLGNWLRFAGSALSTNAGIAGLAIAALNPATPAIVLVAGSVAVVGGLLSLAGNGDSLLQCKRAAIK